MIYIFAAVVLSGVFGVLAGTYFLSEVYYRWSCEFRIWSGHLALVGVAAFCALALSGGLVRWAL